MQKQRTNNLSRFQLLVITILVVFLPFSSWLVSLTGMPNLSLIRDGLVIILFLTTFGAKKVPLFEKKNIPIFLFLLYIMLSFFWTEASPLQWLKGIRLYLSPLLLIISTARINFTTKDLTKILQAVIFSGSIIVVLALLELFGLKLPLTSSHSGLGALQNLHLVGAANIIRLQSVMAGPNALGLYVLVMLAILIAFRDKIRAAKYLILPFVLILILTFSRSAWLGLVALILIQTMLKYKLTLKKIVSLLVLVVVVALSGYAVAKKSSILNQVVFHGDSTSLRVDEYKRIWSERHEIGLLGRGAGAAGPSTQNRLDEGPNRWTENTYLDVFEELGLVGLIIFLTVLLSAFFFAMKNRYETFANTTLIALPSIMLSGLFINFFTGQAGIFLVLFIVGLMYSESRHPVLKA